MIEASLEGTHIEMRWRRGAAAVVWIGLLVGATHCQNSNTTSADGGCQLDDQNGTSGGAKVIDITVNDTGFFVGGPDSGSTSSNVAFENSSNVTLTLFNVGTKPHDLTVQCQAPNSDNCEMQWCFPAAANVPAVQPGQSATTTFTAPFNEGVYVFTSDLAGDKQGNEDSGLTGLVGEFVLM
jgi:hypothetical protein